MQRLRIVDGDILAGRTNGFGITPGGPTSAQDLQTPEDEFSGSSIVEKSNIFYNTTPYYIEICDGRR
jgi:hypothetical protein